MQNEEQREECRRWWLHNEEQTKEGKTTAAAVEERIAEKEMLHVGCMLEQSAETYDEGRLGLKNLKLKGKPKITLATF